jgi:hypothetical protein
MPKERRAAWPYVLFAVYLAKDLKAMRALSAYLSPHHPQSLVIPLQVCQSRVTFLSSLPLIFIRLR